MSHVIVLVFQPSVNKWEMGSCATISQTDGLSHLFGACEFLRVCLSVRKMLQGLPSLRVETAADSTIWAKTSQPSDKITEASDRDLGARSITGQMEICYRVAQLGPAPPPIVITLDWKRSWGQRDENGFRSLGHTAPREAGNFNLRRFGLN
jgi:hypothetical protein